ncbi:hypothetical protein KFK09_023866 [Dendrobium nobile]|uniref:Histidinol-phosphatase n=1 Tax=Dendrobium nobile TaxID=94219 RepID=A0A8T3ACF6_DENNO|nr:hypothetical protein KFK09_023866 [Dendrobium nobile]
MMSAHSRLLLSSNPQHSPCLRRPITKDLHSFPFSRIRSLQMGRIGSEFLRDVKVSSGAGSPVTDIEMDHFSTVANKMADAAGEVIRKYFRQSFAVLDKNDLSPVTIADREAEESMCSIIMESFPTHGIFGEENGWRCKENYADYVWVLDPIDGTKSFITGKPLFGTLIALLYKGKPVRLANYTTSPHLFTGEAELAFSRLRNKVKVPLYGCDCYAYALLASGFVDLVVESGLKPYDFLSLVPVIEGAGGSLTDWKGNKLHWMPSPDSCVMGFNVAAAGDLELHKQALEVLQWQ